VALLATFAMSLPAFGQQLFSLFFISDVCSFAQIKFLGIYNNYLLHYYFFFIVNWKVINFPATCQQWPTDGPLLAGNAGPMLPFLYWATIWPPFFHGWPIIMRKLAKYAGQASYHLLRVCWVECREH
jgi:hypothetical protein